MEEWTDLDTSILGPVGREFQKFAVERIKGQDEAVRKLARVLDRHSSAFKIGNRPIYVSLVVGGAGSGKTLLARTLAEFWFNNSGGFTEVACSNFAETNFSQKVIDQYDLKYLNAVDLEFQMALRQYNENCDTYNAIAGELEIADKLEPDKIKNLELELMEAKKKHDESFGKVSPKINSLRSIIVLDHIEDGPERLQDRLSMIFENGTHYDREGKPISFRNSVIFVTCNDCVTLNDGAKKRVGFTVSGSVGSNKINESKIYLDSIDNIKEYLLAKFLSHIDRVEIFQEYTEKVRLSILEILFKDFYTELAKNFPLELTISDEVKKYIVKEGSDHPEWGIRLLKQKFDKYIRDKVAILIASELIHKKDKIRAEMKKIEEEAVVIFSRNDKM